MLAAEEDQWIQHFLVLTVRNSSECNHFSDSSQSNTLDCYKSAIVKSLDVWSISNTLKDTEPVVSMELKRVFISEVPPKEAHGRSFCFRVAAGDKSFLISASSESMRQVQSLLTT